MDISVTGIGIGLFCVGAGIAIMGYYIGKGLQNFRQPDIGIDYYTLLKESDLQMFLNLSSDELSGLLNDRPDVPKIVLSGTTYYPKKQFIEWLHTKDYTKNE